MVYMVKCLFRFLQINNMKNYLIGYVKGGLILVTLVLLVVVLFKAPFLNEFQKGWMFIFVWVSTFIGLSYQVIKNKLPYSWVLFSLFFSVLMIPVIFGFIEKKRKERK